MSDTEQLEANQKLGQSSGCSTSTSQSKPPTLSRNSCTRSCRAVAPATTRSTP